MNTIDAANEEVIRKIIGLASRRQRRLQELLKPRAQTTRTTTMISAKDHSEICAAAMRVLENNNRAKETAETYSGMTLDFLREHINPDGTAAVRAIASLRRQSPLQKKLLHIYIEYGPEAHRHEVARIAEAAFVKALGDRIAIRRLPTSDPANPPIWTLAFPSDWLFQVGRPDTSSFTVTTDDV